MVEIKKSASAGTMESSDAYVEIEPGNGGLEIRLESVVREQFEEETQAAVREVLEENSVTNAAVRVVDQGRWNAPSAPEWRPRCFAERGYHPPCQGAG